MAEVVIMPKLGFNMDEGQLVKWRKQPGDPVAKGEVLFEINTDKTTMPVESSIDGVLLKIMLAEGDFAAVFTPIAVVGRLDENADALLEGGENATTPQDAAAPAPPDAPLRAAVPAKNDAVKLTPKAKKLIRDQNIDLASLAAIPGTGFRGGTTAKDIKASPLARKVAATVGVDLAVVQGTGACGKIMKADVLASASVCAAAQSPCGKKILSVSPYKGVRKIIGERLAGSKFSAPHVYFAVSVDMSNLTAFRSRLTEAGEGKIAMTDLLVMAASRALRAFPEVNAALVGEEVVCYKSLNIGVAVAGNAGLIVPVVKDVQEKSITDVAKETRDLVERAKEGRLAPEEYSGGTFTVSNLGPFGIEDFTAIINPPESAILAVSAAIKKPVVVAQENGEESIVVRPMATIRLSVDHRVIDGLLAANFVKTIKELLENPIRIMM